MATFSERLKRLREESQLKQEDLAKRLNISTSAYGYYEQGRNEPSLDTLQTLSILFDTSVDYLIGKTDEKKTPASVKVTDELTLTRKEIDLIIELKKHPKFVNDLADDPEHTIARLYRFWQFFQDETKS